MSADPAPYYQKLIALLIIICFPMLIAIGAKDALAAQHKSARIEMAEAIRNECRMRKTAILQCGQQMALREKRHSKPLEIGDESAQNHAAEQKPILAPDGEQQRRNGRRHSSQQRKRVAQENDATQTAPSSPRSPRKGSRRVHE